MHGILPTITTTMYASLTYICVPFLSPLHCEVLSVLAFCTGLIAEMLHFTFLAMYVAENQVE